MDNLIRTELSPLLPSAFVNIIFTPVIKRLTKTINQNHQFFWIKIVVPAQMNTVYYLKNKNECFFRRSDGNAKLSLKEVRQLAVFLTEQRFLVAKDTYNDFI